MKTAIYPGTFDPITFGHIDVIKKSLKIFDRLIVATTDNINKNYYFSIDERLVKWNLYLQGETKNGEFSTQKRLWIMIIWNIDQFFVISNFGVWLLSLVSNSHSADSII